MTTTIKAHFSRTTNPAQYQKAEASLFLETTIDDNVNLDLETSALFRKAKITVFDQLGIEYEETADGVVNELYGSISNMHTSAPDIGDQLRAQFSAVEVPAPAPAGTSAAIPPPPPFLGTPTPAASTSSQVDRSNLVELYQKDPSAWWDNRVGKRNPKGPDFRHKTLKDEAGKYPLALWLSDFEKAGYHF